MKLKKVLGVLAIVLLVYFIINRPDSASNTASSIGTTLKGAADNVISFFSDIAT